MGIGLIRLLLAFSVIVTHSSPVFGYNVANGVVAVRTFFIISGFFIALVLDKKYKSIKNFYRNRALRIYPIYLLVLLLTVAFALFAHTVRGVWGELGYWVVNTKQMSVVTWFEVIGANLGIYGRDLIMFSGFNTVNGNLFFRSDFNYQSAAYNFLLIPQAWAVVLELEFYVIAPFVSKLKNYWLTILICLSLILRYVMFHMGYTSVYWTNRFFLNELVFFLIGIVSYRIYRHIKESKTKLGRIPQFSSLVIISLLLVLNFIPGNGDIKEGVFYVIFASLLPFVFIYSKDNRSDRLLGDFSYPIYMSHVLIITVIYPYLFNTFVGNKNFLAPLVLIISMGFSYIVNRYFQAPIEKIRSAKV